MRTTSVPGHLGPHGRGHELVVDGDDAGRFDGQAEEGIRVGKEVADGAELGRDEPIGLRGIRIPHLGRVAREDGLGGVARAGVGGSGGVGARLRRVEEHPAARVVQDEIVEDEQPRPARERLVDEVVRGPVAHLVDGAGRTGARPDARRTRACGCRPQASGRRSRAGAASSWNTSMA